MNPRNLINIAKRTGGEGGLRRGLLALISFSSLWTAVTHAAETNAPELVPPPGPSWIRPKSPTSWTIDFRYPNASAKESAAEGRLTKVAVTTIGKATLESIKCSKVSFDVWTTEGFTFLANPETGEFDLRGNAFPILDNQLDGESAPQKPGGGGMPELPPQYQDWAGLKEFDWIRPELFQGTIKQGAEVLHVYAELPEDMLAARRPAAPAAASTTPASKPGAPGTGRPAAPTRPPKNWPPGPLGGMPLRPDIKVVAVNAETNYPHFLQLGEIVREYAFSTPAGSALEMPGPIVKVLKMFGR